MPNRERAERPERGTNTSRRHVPSPGPAPVPPGRLSPESVLALQQMMGNDAVARLIDDDAVRHDAMDLVDKATRRPGSPLPTRLRHEMESDFNGADFGDVRSRIDRESAEAIGAKAYTTKTNQIVFRSVADMDEHTLRHELGHVQQQRAGLATPGVSHPADDLEQAAEANAIQIELEKRSVQGSRDGFPEHAATANVTVQRMTEPMNLDDEDYDADYDEEFFRKEFDKLDKAEEGAIAGHKRKAEEPPDERSKRKRTWIKRARGSSDGPVELRMLNRVARILYQGLREAEVTDKVDGGVTPHLAVVLKGDKFRVSGNTDRKIKKTHMEKAEGKLKEAIDKDTEISKLVSGEWVGDSEGALRQRQRRLHKDATKLRLVGEDGYVIDGTWRGKFLDALKGGVSWDLEFKNRADKNSAERERYGNVHGEMFSLYAIINEHWSQDPKEGAPVYLGGSMKPCRACQWVIDAVNSEILEPRGFKVRASESHNSLFDNWKMPDWLWSPSLLLAPSNSERRKSLAEAKKMVTAKAGEGGWSFDKDGKILGRTHRVGEPKDSYPEESDSDYEID